MVKYREFKGRYVHWAAKGVKGRARPTGRIVDLPDRKPQVWYPAGTGNLVRSYERVQTVKKTKPRRKSSVGFGFKIPNMRFP